MENYYQARLQLVSLILEEASEDDYSCEISLSKGIQQFGQIKFNIDKNAKMVNFDEGEVIEFNFPPMLPDRKDTPFKVNFADFQSSEIFGTFEISTNWLSQTHAHSKNQQINCQNEFYEQARLIYKILFPKNNYQKHIRFESPRKSRRKNSMDFDSILDSMFADSEPKNTNLKTRINSPSMASIKQETVQEDNIKEQSPNSNLLSVFDFLIRKNVHIEQIAEAPAEDNNESSILSSTSDEMSDPLLIFDILKSSANKKLTLIPTHEHSQPGHKFSWKVTVVFFLLIFGAIFLSIDLLKDKTQLSPLRSETHPHTKNTKHRRPDNSQRRKKPVAKQQIEKQQKIVKQPKRSKSKRLKTAEKKQQNAA